MASHKDTKRKYSVGTIHGKSLHPGNPLPVAGCHIMLCTRGNAEITVYSRRFDIRPGRMAFIVFDMVAVPVRWSDDFEARYIALDFDAAQDIFFLVTSNRFWEFVYHTPVFKLNHDDAAAARCWFGILDWIEANCTPITAEKAMRNETENFMQAMADRVERHLGALGSNPPKNRAWVIVNEFIGLLNRYCTRHHDVAFYADRLNITPNYLNIIVKKNIGTTAKEQINIQLSLVVKMLLDTTDLTIKEIAERLHYADPSYLCRIFRKQHGLSPLQYRNLQRVKSGQ